MTERHDRITAKLAEVAAQQAETRRVIDSMLPEVVVWTPTERLAVYLRHHLIDARLGRWHIVVGEVERLRGYCLDRLLVYDPLNVIPTRELVWAKSRIKSGKLEYLEV